MGALFGISASTATREVGRPMAIRSNISRDDFDRLLLWFRPNRDVSAKNYVKTHERLTGPFHFKGCNRPEDLADEVTDRVAKRLPWRSQP